LKNVERKGNGIGHISCVIVRVGFETGLKLLK